MKVIKTEHRHVDLETKTEAWRQGLAHKAIHNRNQRIASSRKDNEDSIMQELFAREILPAWRVARAFVGGPEVAGNSCNPIISFLIEIMTFMFSTLIKHLYFATFLIV